VPVPVVEVIERLLSYISGGGVVGAVKFWADVQIVRLVAAVVVMNSVALSSSAKPGVPGEFDDAESTSITTPVPLAEHETGPALIILVAQTVSGPPLIE